MAQRGEVVVSSRRVGFAAKGEPEAFVVVQADPLNVVLPTVLVIPLDHRVALYAGNPRAVPVSAAEAGSAVEHVAITTQLRPVRVDQLAPGAVGRVSRRTMTLLNRTLKLVLDL